ncbi:MAG TPA: PQQ-binding-like beta-propeller repeat protein [Steroidobacteraceae bacterium]|nr:PQQ-binding-like beta-propeller repeat protein [Steroidobacteraceae bacterium]HEX5162240.1 PQQ-binding-like beta-propeller repeat protein [Steroidobacteraceae bacterium]
MALQFIEKDGKQEAHLSLPTIGAYDINLGEVAISGNSIETRGFKFPLTWNPDTRTLSGHLPADAAPIYDIPVTFKRGEPLAKKPPGDWKAPRPTPVWTLDTGAPVWAGIERHGDSGTLFVGNELGVLHAIDSRGKLRWKFETGAPIRAQPKVIGGDVFVSSDSGYLYKLSIGTGAEAWRARVVADAPARIPTDNEKTRWDRFGSSVVTDGKRLYIASRDRNLYALDMTGHELWRFASGDIMTATPALYGDLVIIADFAGTVRALSTKDGAPRWSYDAKLGVGGDVVVAGDRVLVGSRSYDLIALNAADGKELWKHYYWFSWIESPPVVRDGVVYTGSSDATNVYAINLADGSLRWKTPVPGYAWQRVAIYKEWLIAGTVGQGKFPGPRAGSLMALDPGNGAVRWIYLDAPTGEMAKSRENWGFGAAPVVGDGAVYAVDLKGRVYAFELK